MSKHKRGFTIVEIVVVVVAIGILATITVVGYNGWRTSTIETAVKNDLSAYFTAMESVRMTNNGYPTSKPSAFVSNNEVTTVLDSRSTTQRFCVTATSGVIVFHITNENKEPAAGSCADNWS